MHRHRKVTRRWLPASTLVKLMSSVQSISAIGLFATPVCYRFLVSTGEPCRGSCPGGCANAAAEVDGQAVY